MFAEILINDVWETIKRSGYLTAIFRKRIRNSASTAKPPLFKWLTQVGLLCWALYGLDLWGRISTKCPYRNEKA
jgi:hypothetical protein